MVQRFLWALHLINGAWCLSERNMSAVYKKLHSDLMKGYDRNARPVLYNANVTTVEINLFFFSTFEIDEKSQTISIGSHMGLHWRDHHLSWNPDDYKAILSLPMSPDEIWMPDIYETSKGGPSSDLRQADYSFTVLTFHGFVLWNVATMLPGRCEFEYSNYPNDIAKCKITLKAWSLREDALELDAHAPFADRRAKRRIYDFPEELNSEWQIASYVATRRVRRSRTKNISYYVVQFELTLSRKTPIPQQRLLWISSVTVVLLTLGMFWIPSDIEQKMTVGCVAVIILNATLLTVCSTAGARLIAIILASKIHNVMYVVTIAILLEIIAINLQHIQRWEPPEVLLGFFSGTLGRVLLISSTYRETTPADRMKLREYESGDTMLEPLVAERNWKTISQAFERVAFFIFVVILSVIPKS